jgi:hypothetical protein
MVLPKPRRPEGSSRIQTPARSERLVNCKISFSSGCVMAHVLEAGRPKPWGRMRNAPYGLQNARNWPSRACCWGVSGPQKGPERVFNNLARSEPCSAGILPAVAGASRPRCCGRDPSASLRAGRTHPVLAESARTRAGHRYRFRSSPAITPSLMKITRCAYSAMSCSCVTSTIVLPSACRRSNRAMISLPV